MTARQHFRELVRARRRYPRYSLDWQWRTRAARKYLAIVRGEPTTEWINA